MKNQAYNLPFRRRLSLSVRTEMLTYLCHRFFLSFSMFTVVLMRKHRRGIHAKHCGNSCRAKIGMQQTIWPNYNQLCGSPRFLHVHIFQTVSGYSENVSRVRDFRTFRQSWNMLSRVAEPLKFTADDDIKPSVHGYRYTASHADDNKQFSRLSALSRGIRLTDLFT